MKQVVLALCSLVNLANKEHLDLLGKLVGFRFSVGFLTLGAYGIERAGATDPVVVALSDKTLIGLSGEDLRAQEIATIISGLKVSLSDAECILLARTDTSVIIACDSVRATTLFQEHLPSTTILNSLDLLTAGVEQGQLSVKKAIAARSEIDSRTGLLTSNKFDYFIGKC